MKSLEKSEPILMRGDGRLQTEGVDKMERFRQIACMHSDASSPTA